MKKKKMEKEELKKKSEISGEKCKFVFVHKRKKRKYEKF